MNRGGEMDGSARPAADLHPTTRLGLLAILIAATLASAVYLGFAGFSLGQAVFLALSVGLAFCAALVFARQAAIAAAMALVPLAAALWCVALAYLLHVPLVAPIWLYAFGTAAAIFVGDAFISDVLADRAAVAAASQTIRIAAPPMLAAAASAVAVTAAAALPGFKTPALLVLCMLAAYALVGAVVLAGLPLVIGRLALGEPFIVRANRVREARLARAWRASMVSVPRWGMSVSGITLVIATLAWFGGSHAISGGDLSPLFGAAVAAAVVATAAFAISATWRDCVGVLLGIGAAATLALWSAAILGSPLYVAIEGLNLALPAFFAVAFRARRLRSGGEETAIARLRAIEETSGAVMFSTLGAVGAILPAAGSGAEVAFPVLLGGAFASVLSAPAIATALEALFPRYRSVEELYTRPRSRASQ